MAELVSGVPSIADIPATDIRTALRQTMVMGLPSVVADRPTFYWDKEVTFAEHDSADSPWDWTAAPTLDDTPTEQQVICAFEFAAPFGRTGAVPERIGEFNISTVIITLFEDEYAAIDGFTWVTIGPELSRRWYFRYVQPTTSLGALSVYSISCAAEDT